MLATSVQATRKFVPRNLFLSLRRQSRSLLTLAIETSCDDTGVAILETPDDNIITTAPTAATLLFNKRITSNNVSFGGIHPLVAMVGHQEKLATLIAEAIDALPSVDSSSQQQPNASYDTVCHINASGDLKLRRKPDLIAVTRGPGMRSNLTTGLDTAKGLSVAWQRPMLGVHHMQAHALTPRLESAMQIGAGEALEPKFPFLTLLVSGGHTLLLRSTSVTDHRILASTMDTAIGDCLDKVTREIVPSEILEQQAGRPYGAILEDFAFPDASELPQSKSERMEDFYDYTAPKNRFVEIQQSEEPTAYGWPFPAPLLISRGGQKANSMEFSFVGTVTYASRVARNGWDPTTNKLGKTPRSAPLSLEERKLLARYAMRAVFKHLASRVVLALNAERKDESAPELSETLVVSGGVAANKFLRHVLRQFLDVRGYEKVAVVAPRLDLCTDNAAMIAWAADEMYRAGHRESALSIRALRRWSLENLLHPERDLEAEDNTVAARKMTSVKNRELAGTNTPSEDEIHEQG